jgi:hypothetical protein
MQGIYTYIPETNHVPREYSVAAILLLLFMVHITLFPMLNLLHFYISTFRSMCVVPNMAVFCNSLISCFPGTLLRYFLNYFEMVPVAPIITDVSPPAPYTVRYRIFPLALSHHFCMLLYHEVTPRWPRHPGNLNYPTPYRWGDRRSIVVR